MPLFEIAEERLTLPISALNRQRVEKLAAQLGLTTEQTASFLLKLAIASACPPETDEERRLLDQERWRQLRRMVGDAVRSMLGRT